MKHQSQSNEKIVKNFVKEERCYIRENLRPQSSEFPYLDCQMSCRRIADNSVRRLNAWKKFKSLFPIYVHVSVNITSNSNLFDQFIVVSWILRRDILIC